MNAVDRVIRWSTAGAVVGVAAVGPYQRAYVLCAHGEGGRTGRLVPLTVHGLIYASSMVMLGSARWVYGADRATLRDDGSGIRHHAVSAKVALGVGASLAENWYFCVVWMTHTGQARGSHCRFVSR
jgi:hypothetical protein